MGRIARIVKTVFAAISGGRTDQTPSETTRILLVGHDARKYVLRTIGKVCQSSAATSGDLTTLGYSADGVTYHFSALSSDSNSQAARAALSTADIVVLVIDVIDQGAYDAPFAPLFDACAAMLSEQPPSEIILLFANTARIFLDKPDAVELLELLELDVLKFLCKHGLDGDNACRFYDSPNVIPEDHPPTGTSVKAVVDYITKARRHGHSRQNQIPFPAEPVQGCIRKMDFELDHPSGIRVHRGLTLAPFAKWYDKEDDGHGSVRVPLLPFHDGEVYVGVVLYFYQGKLKGVSLTDRHSRFGTSWTEETERLKAESIEAWLSAKGYPVGEYPWGSVFCGFDGKIVEGSASIRFT